MRRLMVLLASLITTATLAANVPYVTGPWDSGNLPGTINGVIGSINANTAGLLNAATGATATGPGTTEQTLQTFTVPANTLVAAGQALRIRCWGVTGATANNKTMKLYFGASVITTPTAATNAKGWYLELNVMRTGSATQAVWGNGIVDTTPLTVYTNAGTDDLTTNLVARCTGTDGTSQAADITANGMITEVVK